MVRVKEREVDIDELLNHLEPKQKEIIQNLRELVKSTVPETIEIVKHGNIAYKLGDNDFVWIRRYQNHVDLEFAMGASLDSDLLKSTGKEKPENLRHVSVTATDFEKLKPEITRLLKEAESLGFKHCSTSA